MEILWLSHGFSHDLDHDWIAVSRKVSMYVLMLPSLDARKLTWEGALVPKCWCHW
jgi:hypothetical protein